MDALKQSLDAVDAALQAIALVDASMRLLSRRFMRHLTNLTETQEMDANSRTTVLSTKGEVILPKAIRDQLGWEAGTRLIAECTADGILLKAAASAFPQTQPEQVFGCLPYSGCPKSIEEMNQGVVLEARRRHVRARTRLDTLPVTAP